MVIEVFFARLRARRHHMKMTHVLMRCLRCTDGSLVLEQAEDRNWNFETVWHLSRQMMSEPWSHIQVSALKTKPNPDDGSVQVLDGCEGPWEVWPKLFKRIREPTLKGPVIGDEKKPPKRTRRGGGIRALLPASVLGGDVDDDVGDDDLTEDASNPSCSSVEEDIPPPDDIPDAADDIPGVPAPPAPAPAAIAKEVGCSHLAYTFYLDVRHTHCAFSIHILCTFFLYIKYVINR